MTTPDGRTPGTADVDQPQDGAHGGEAEQDASGRTPAAPDQAEGDDAPQQ